MSDISQVVEVLEDRLKLILERYDFLKEENELLRNEMQQIQQDAIQKNRQIEELKENIGALSVGKTIQGSDNIKITTGKINELIKDLDWCIAQLSD